MAVLLYRLSHALWVRRVPKVPALIRSVAVALYGCDVSPSASLGPGLHFVHTVGVVVGWETRAGRNLKLCQNVTLGGRGVYATDGRWTPTLGDDVTIYAGAVVLGPITLGDGVTVGANSVVMHDVPAGATVVGNPARTIEAPVVPAGPA